MPGPFPGMDPYLENPLLWPGVHHGLISAIRAQINAVLPEQYVADVGERVYLAQSARDVIPDAVVYRDRSPATARGATAVASSTVADPPWRLVLEPLEVREGFIEIRSVRPGRRVVTVIEILSPSNKLANSDGRRQYLEKQRELLGSAVSLLEIDLLRAGAHTVAAPYEHLELRGRWDYLVCLHRGSTPRELGVWPIRLRDRLPWIRVPLADEDHDVQVDLQVSLDRCYDEGLYRRLAEYSGEPVPPLAPAEKEWAEALLREAGLRPAA
ncbi:MAG: DUF4058 family protein [Armatimonadota bacterium]